MTGASRIGIPLEYVLFLSEQDVEWGQRLVALVRFKREFSSEVFASQLASLKQIIQNWPPAERPIAWYQCHQLSPNQIGKWERLKWTKWLESKRNSTYL